MNFIQSPVGLVPKDNGKKTQLIFHLSYDFHQEESKQNSLNYYTPRHLASVQYNDLDCVISELINLAKISEENIEMVKKRCHDRGQEVITKDGKKFVPIYSGKTDVQSAFRLVPLSRWSWQWLIMKAQDPLSGEWKYFIDKCLPFGASISCAIFQEFSDALRYLAEYRTQSPGSINNYLDDFLFLARTLIRCNYLMQQFFILCEEIGVPISEEKTEWASLRTIFLGILLDGKSLTLAIPVEKKNRAINTLMDMIDHKKAAVKELQSLCGYLNFLCKVIFPGRTFVRRMYSKFSKVMDLPFRRRS